MTFSGVLGVLRRRWLLVLGGALLGLVAALTSHALTPPTYTADVTLYASAADDGNPANAAAMAQLAQARVTSYVELVGSPRVAEMVAARLNLSESPGAIAERITADTPLDSTLVNVAVTDRSPQRAADIANEVADVFTGMAASLDTTTVPGDTSAVRMVVAQPAAVPDAPSSPGLALVVALGLLGGLAVGIASAFLAHRLDDRARRPSDVEDATGVRVLGTVPATDDHTEPLDAAGQEAFRAVAAALRFGDHVPELGVLMVATPDPDDDPTGTTLRLAETLAAAGRLVLVVDADLRPARFAASRPAHGPGLTSFLVDGDDLDLLVRRAPSRAYDLLTTGPRRRDAPALLDSDRLDALAAAARARYDVVLVTVPPVPCGVDAAVVAGGCDGVVLICTAEGASRRALAAACATLRAVPADLRGVVLTTGRATAARGGLRGRRRRARAADEARPGLLAIEAAPRRAVDDEARAAEADVPTVPGQERRNGVLRPLADVGANPTTDDQRPPGDSSP